MPTATCTFTATDPSGRNISVRASWSTWARSIGWTAEISVDSTPIGTLSGTLVGGAADDPQARVIQAVRKAIERGVGTKPPD